ncbi:kinase-like protein [Dothidotthia symphoricarpi CBS 119687]|uniref:Kinase-like protein n=1 Tax=Dothidotthia symphoricarpi CBS 119687 TaxID=1392245 RepID=A0A6A5ZYD2_9PLEO|nr:kinase-like protein [Dothidotthia symphoricarpi CBS 119687]KAF2124306.1 kinase-like protein [Dothidotthia symphoricarpi CBS 119687]
MAENADHLRMISIEEGKDYLLENDEELPYTLLKNLGHGHSANVEMVKDQRTGAVFARKVFRLGGSRSERERVFENEIRIIRRLAPHHHFIQVFATYVAKRDMGLILSPVASRGDLHTFLQDVRERPCTIVETRILQSAFGCLASGLEFMHTQNVRHKDIKPQNILIHNGTVIYTDFGYSFDHSTAARSTTEGRPDALTKRYCAPEVAEYAPRNSKSDIFSLGCVFFELYSALGLCGLPETTTWYHLCLEEVTALLRNHRPCNRSFAAASNIICQMLDLQPGIRPPAEAVCKRLRRRGRKYFCIHCRAAHNVNCAFPTGLDRMLLVEYPGPDTLDIEMHDEPIPSFRETPQPRHYDSSHDYGSQHLRVGDYSASQLREDMYMDGLASEQSTSATTEDAWIML